MAGHREAQTLSATVHATLDVGVIPLEVVAELSPLADKLVYAAWDSHDLSVGDTVEIKVIEGDTPDSGSVIEHGVGQVGDGTALSWPLCSMCGKACQEVTSMISGRRLNLCDSCVDSIIALRRE